MTTITVHEPSIVPATPHANVTPIGVLFDRSITVDEWTAIGERLEQHDRALRWIVGDWLVFGGETFGARAAVIADSLNLSTGSVANAASVCRRVPFERRRAELSFSHHEEVAHLDEPGQRRLLDTAVSEGLSKSVLRQLVQEEDRTRREIPPVEPASSSSGDSVPVPPARPVGPVTVTFVLAGELPADRGLIDDGVGRVREGLEAWFGGHGYATTVELR